jgi:hypothetical protein
MFYLYSYIAVVVTATSAANESMPISSSWADLLTVAVSIAVMIGGFTIIKDIRMKSFDSLFGFCTRLRAYCLRFRLLLGVRPGTEADKNSVLYYIANQNEPVPQSLEDMFGIFRSFILEFRTFMETADGQVPLTSQMSENVDWLYEILLQYSFYPKGIPAESIQSDYDQLTMKLNQIVGDIKSSKAKLLKSLWKKTS